MTLLPEKVNDFADAFEKAVQEQIKPEQLIPEINIDAVIQFSEINPNMFNILAQMEPFGPDNMRPVFIAKKVMDTGFSKIVKEQHIRFVVKQQNISFTGIGFNMAAKFPILQQQQPVDLVFTLDENEWNGEKNIQLKMIDLRLSETV